MHWYLIYTKAHHEKKVKERLERERFEIFIPLVERWSQGKDCEKRIHLPLFPGYLFVRAEMNASIYLKILRIKGVHAFFCNGGKPAIIPDEEVESIQVPLKDGKDVKFQFGKEHRGFTASATSMNLIENITKPDKPDRPNKPNRLNRPEKLKKPERPEKPEKRSKRSNKSEGSEQRLPGAELMEH